MPIYEYKCNTCQEEFELLVFSHEQPACPKCASKNLTKKISKVNFRNTSDSTTSSSGTSSCHGCSSKNCSTCR